MKRVIAIYAASLLASAAIAAPVYAQDSTGNGSTSTETQIDAGAGADANAGTDTTTGADVNADAGADANAGAGTSDETTASIDITTDQQTELRTIFSETEIERAASDVSVSVGTAIPATIELHPLPPRVVEIVPAYKDYQYFTLSDGRIVIVEPASKKVVYVLS